MINICGQNEKTPEQLGYLNIFFINIINDLVATLMSMVKSTHIVIIKISWTMSTIKPWEQCPWKKPTIKTLKCQHNLFVEISINEWMNSQNHPNDINGQNQHWRMNDNVQAEVNIKHARTTSMNKVINKGAAFKVFYNFHQIFHFHKVSITTNSNHKDVPIWCSTRVHFNNVFESFLHKTCR